MKRNRETSLDSFDSDVVSAGEIEENRPLTKAERNEKRKAENKKWKTLDPVLHDRNPRHSLYYRIQLPELSQTEDWNKFQLSLASPMPVCFRFGGYCADVVRQSLRKSMNGEFRNMKGRYIEVGGAVLKDDIVKKIEWAGDNTWQISVDSSTLATNPGFESLSNLLIHEVTLGNIVRQELASMIPALLLDVQSHHRVLDVCAAPGSKTEQLLSIMKAKTPAGGKCTGMVVANDGDMVRIETLKRRYARCGSPNLVCTCSRAEDLQRVIATPTFDRIVADVPCSGDGTVRKFPHLWRLFRSRVSLELHVVQLQIAMASVLMLRPQGRFVYSTCSINPMEDESVVAALLRHYNGSLKLVNTREEGLLPGLISRPGLRTWSCTPEVFCVGEDEEGVKQSLARQPPLVASMQPPTSAEASWMNLEYCHRILPQDNDTGGFFVAVFELSMDNTDVAIKSKSKSNKKKKATEVSEANSMNVMKQLGYNPKPSRAGDSAATRTSSEPVGKYSLCSNELTNQIGKCVHFKHDVLSTVSDDESIYLYHSSNATMCPVSSSTGSNRSEEIVRDISLMSKQVHLALASWASPSDKYPDILVQAGVTIGSATMLTTHDETSYVSSLSLCANGMGGLLPYVSDEHVVALNQQDFKILASLPLAMISSGGTWGEESEAVNVVNEYFNNLLKDIPASHPFVNGELSSQGHERVVLSLKQCTNYKNGNVSNVVFVCNQEPEARQSNTCIASSAVCDTTTGTATHKRRLSKFERKRLAQGAAAVEHETPQSNNKDIHSHSGPTEGLGNVSKAGLVFQHRAHEEVCWQCLTETDVCQSYIRSLSSVA